MRFPVTLAVAQTARDIPGEDGKYVYEPKFDGWRCCAWTGRGRLHSRSGTDITDRFPEIMPAVGDLGDVVLDGELVALRQDPPRLDFAALQASPRRRRGQAVGVYFMVFDVLACDGRDLRWQPYHERRQALVERVPCGSGRVQLVANTDDHRAAREWMDPAYGAVGIEDVVSKRIDAAYGGRCGWWKTRATLTTEAAVLGVTSRSVVLGRANRHGQWRAVGLSQPLSRVVSEELLDHVSATGAPQELPGVVAGLPGSEDVTYQPTKPSVVVDVEADHAIEFGRFRHPPKVLRIRGDLTPEQLPPF